jgi:peptide-methionine (R)-S-oxide reductase
LAGEFSRLNSLSIRIMNCFTRSAAVALAFCAFACNAEDKNDPKKVNDQPAKTEDLTKLSKEELAKKLDKEAYYVCIMGGTERPFQNKYWNNHEEGIYVDVISGKPLFASSTKFESGSGWPSFFEPIDKAEIVEHKDTAHGMVRIEVRAKASNAHLGHVFDDGPRPTGLRYCINSAALKFIPKDKLKEAGLEKYAGLLENKAAK